MLEVTLGLLAIIFVLAYFYFTSTYNYWRDKGVVFVKPYPLVGSMWKQITLQEHVSKLFRRIYFDYPDQPYVGFYQGLVPSLLIRDPDLIKNIMVKDFAHFTDHGVKVSEDFDPLMAKNLFNIRGQKWKHMRTKLAPVFTSGRMKAMFPMVLKCAQNLESFLKNAADFTGEVELKDILERYTTDVIGTNVFGIACDSIKEPNNTFRLMSKKLIETDLIQGIRVAIITYIPGLANKVKATFFKPVCAVYFRALVNDIIASRAASGETKKDFMQLLIDLMEHGKLNNEDEQEPSKEDMTENDVTEKITYIDILAQASVFLFAGFETSSSAMTFALFELSRRPDLQRTARQHIEEVLQRHDGELTYQALQDMTYLDWILQGMLEVTLGLLAIIFVLAYFYFTSTFNYWRDKGVVFVKPCPLIGSMWRQITVQEHVIELFRRIYFEYPDQPYVGFYQGLVPTLLIRDPELIKNIIVKDFTYFTDHGIKFNEKADPLLARNLFSLKGQSWKNMRAKLAPVFTSGRMKAMFPMALQCAQNLEAFLENVADTSSGDIELKDILARYTTDVIGSNVFGIACDSLNEPNNKFRLMSKKLLETDAIQGMKLAITTYIPGMGDVIKGTFFKPECEAYFRKLINDIITSRTASGEKRKDFLQLLIELNEKGYLNNEDDMPNENDGATENNDAVNERLTDSELLAQASIFFFAGFETSSSAVACGLYELARRPDLQRIARQHIEEVLQRHNGELTYQAFQDMTYLDWIVQETLRKYPTLTVFRECTKMYKIPGSDVTIEEGTPIVIPNYGLHYDPKFFPDPDEFIPERFSDAEMVKNNQYIYLPFGEGPRLCIGKRFAYMQSKLGLMMFLRKFEVQANAKTATSLFFDPRLFLLATKHDIFAKIVRI